MVRAMCLSPPQTQGEAIDRMSDAGLPERSPFSALSRWLSGTPSAIHLNPSIDTMQLAPALQGWDDGDDGDGDSDSSEEVRIWPHLLTKPRTMAVTVLRNQFQ